MEKVTSDYTSKNEIINKQKARLERLFTQVESGQAVEIIRYDSKGMRSVTSQAYNGGNREIYNYVMRSFFDDITMQLREGEKLRIQLLSRAR